MSYWIGGSVHEVCLSDPWAESDWENKKIYTSWNFYGGYVAHAMDTLKICAWNLAVLLDK